MDDAEKKERKDLFPTLRRMGPVLVSGATIGIVFLIATSGAKATLSFMELLNGEFSQWFGELLEAQGKTLQLSAWWLVAVIIGLGSCYLWRVTGKPSSEDALTREHCFAAAALGFCIAAVLCGFLCSFRNR